MPSFLRPAIVLGTVAMLAPQAAHADACEVNRGARSCASTSVRHEIDWSFWSSIGDVFIGEEYSSCNVGHDYDQPQDVFPFTCQFSGPVRVTISNLECNIDLFILENGCDSRYNCEYASTNGGRSNDYIEFDCEAGELYYLVMERKDESFWFWEDCDRWSGFSYTLTTECFEICWDDADNDADGLVDCLDPDCPVCQENCVDGVDNDYDTLVDCQDPDCSGEDACCDKDSDGYTAAGGICGGDDCNDNAATGGADQHPNQVEIPGDGIDQNCDGFEDCFIDLDGDHFGISAIVQSTVFTCAGPGLAPVDGDCDDTNIDIFPGRPEIPVNGVDDNCDLIEECYLDDDGDDFGSDLIIESGDITCTLGGVSLNNDDCDDENDIVFPGAPELPISGSDENCDGLEICYKDADGDEFGDPNTTVETPFIECDGPGVAINALDCDDRPGIGATIFPGAVEGVADGIDQNCDGLEVCYVDADEDTFGSSMGNTTTSPALDCIATRVSPNDQDCDDTQPSIYPGAPDPSGDAVDQNCDGLQDCYVDSDGDGYGDSNAALIPSGAPGCIGVGISADGGDCDDANNAIYPGAQEGPNDGVDQDCDGFESCYRDADGDGYGRSEFKESTALDCVGSGVSARNDDCNDVSPEGVNIHPGATEIPLNGFDDDCNGFELCYRDNDIDGYGTDAGTLVESGAVLCNVAGVSPNMNDCDDSRQTVNPGRTETPANNLDENCDGDELCFTDNDHDTFGVLPTKRSADLTCSVLGVANDDDDCDDSRVDVYPGAPTPANPTPGLDYACAGFVTCFQDSDQDGFGSDVVVASSDPACSGLFISPNSDDCDDANPNIKPGATELPIDDVDQDCDGQEICYQDRDLDGHGSIITQLSTDITCNTDGVAKLKDDCNDNPNANGANIYPGAPEIVASGVDENCDTMELCYVDQDRDDYGRDTTILKADLTCDGLDYANVNGDCNDNQAGGFGINPGRTEIPVNGIDEDCDAADVCFIDLDGDGYGRASMVVSPHGLSCVGAGVAERSGDCNDNPPDGIHVHPGATEIPGNGIDEDCDSTEICYFDNDNDDYGSTATKVSTSIRCLNLGEAALTGDCDDGNPAINPGVAEIPADGFDQNCDLMEDCYVDQDRDAYGSTILTQSPTLTCIGDRIANNDDDCFDVPPLGGTVHPGAVEIVGNGLDDNCDGQEACYADGDNDNYGRNTVSLTTALDCDAPNFARTNDDCDDLDTTINPGAIEIPADEVDQDCDGKEDCYIDADGDHFGRTTTRPDLDLTCLAIGVADNPDDCNDDLATGGVFVYPGATEIPGNGIDENCDGVESCFLDLDQDDYGGTTTTLTPAFDCNAPNATSVGGDCNDGDPTIHPNAVEIVADGIDQDCDNGDTCYLDVDGDHYGSTGLRPSPDLDCNGPGEATNATDCLDSGSITTNVDGVTYTALSAAVNPGAAEICNFLDDDCDGDVDDDDATLQSTLFWYPDNDDDGYGATSGEVASCLPPSEGYGNQSGDCNDEDGNINPGADEVCDPLNVDEDCNGRADDLDVDSTTGLTVALGATTVYPDADNDGYGTTNPAGSLTTCDVPANYADDNTDCLDTNGNVNPGRHEVPYNGLDDDCDSSTLDDDLDGDGYPHATDCNDNPNTGANINPAASEATGLRGVDDDCDGVVDDGTRYHDDDGDGYTEEGGDCNDTNPNVHPGAVEVANNVDDDCDGPVDEGTIRSDDDGDGWTENAGDCNDDNAAIHPGVTENCTVSPDSAICNDGIDNDCNGSVDGGSFDPDNDGYTDAGGDCDETDPNIHPGAVERPNNVDDDCDGDIDEGTTLVDDDGDGFSEQDGDCNDDDALIHPDRTEQQNGYDDNCDGVIDEGSNVTDDDGDGLSEAEGDCNDNDPTIGPNQPEITNGIDDDCDNLIDENGDDIDEDGWSTDDGDCDDDNGWVNPGREEVCDGLDNDCDGTIDLRADGGDACSDTITPEPKTDCSEGCSNSGGGAPMLLPLMVVMAGLRRRQTR